MLDLIASLSAWPPALAGERLAVATIVAASGSVPRPVGTSMLVSETGAVLGSLSGGCVEGAVLTLALETMDDGGTRLETFGYSTADAFAAGLTCGGELEVHIEPFGGECSSGGPLRAALGQIASYGPADPVALVRRVDAGGSGAVVVPDPVNFRAAGSAEMADLLGLTWPADEDNAAAAAQLESVLRGIGTGLIRLAGPGSCRRGTASREAESPEPVTLLVESRLPAPRMLVCGANDFSAALLPAAKLLGYHVTLIDARPAFAAQARLTATADEVVTGWPHRYLAAEAAAGRLDRRTVLCVLTHDPKFDLPLLEAALDLDLAFVGAMGSRRSHLQRVEDLLDAGVRPERIARLHSPIGLDIGAVTPAEVAVSVTAEIIAARSRTGSGLPLRDTSGPIHRNPIHSQPAAELAASLDTHQEIAWT
ncbi:xanthine dehydrogenase accessory factor [Arthrobacter sp. V4I6]|uniref:XdhC family protein n=1 Tax=unclassified Arthrobacter TaxID=235627 RepID=UPI00278610AE|nr:MULTISPECIES: XdhC/CoxI family protein [unclassified Arthrobacter]MDQ0821315.1 xanthine dehydrogenase accessory factor [Arthrobacter sp. V1I7]MDQ0855580.1 xanthine dehydrogenase accessory factor [Arthrobacter sp. V4I6]